MSDTATALTTKQQAIYNYIRKHIETKGFPPAIRDICDAFGISSPNGVMCHLKALQKKGYIHRVEKRDNKQRAQARGITIPGVSAGGFSLPLRGVVAAGRAIETEETDDRLEPMNSTMEPILVDPTRQDVQILGVLAGVIRRC